MKSHRIEFESHDNATHCLNDGVLDLLARVNARFFERRQSLLAKRIERAKSARTGERLSAPEETLQIRQAEWKAEPRATSFTEIRHDFEDGIAPAWGEILRVAQAAVREGGWIRPRGLHLEERHCRQDGKAVPAAFFDLVVSSFAPNPQFFVPKVEGYLEARLWSDVIHFIEEERKIPRSSIPVGVEIESVYGVVEAEEIFFELKEHLAWVRFDPKDYASNWLKMHANSAEFLTPDLTQLSVREAWLSPIAHYVGLVCEKRGAHYRCGAKSLSPEPRIVPESIIFVKPTFARVREVLSFCQDFLDHWIRGEGRMKTADGMKDLSDFELARCQLWQWVKYRVELADAPYSLTQERYFEWREEELLKLKQGTNPEITRLYEASRTLDALILNATIAEFSIPVAQGYLKSA